jgi:hypothetical protein
VNDGKPTPSHKIEKKKKGGGCHTVALPFTFKKYLKAKEELWKLKYFTIKILQMKPKILQIRIF